jgi:hypothetical protein
VLLTSLQGRREASGLNLWDKQELPSSLPPTRLVRAWGCEILLYCSALPPPSRSLETGSVTRGVISQLSGGGERVTGWGESTQSKMLLAPSSSQEQPHSWFLCTDTGCLGWLNLCEKEEKSPFHGGSQIMLWEAGNWFLALSPLHFLVREQRYHIPYF